MSIARMALVNLKLALTVAIRFSATRRQFGPKDTEEVPVLEYQTQVRVLPEEPVCESSLPRRSSPVLLLQQWRLIPYLAAAYALEHFTKSFFLNFVEFQMGQMMKDKSDRQVRNCGRE